MKLHKLVDIYMALLSHPHDEWRARNQKVYCLVLDEIAEVSGEDREFVQTMYEERLARIQAYMAAHE